MSNDKPCVFIVLSKCMQAFFVRNPSKSLQKKVGQGNFGVLKMSCSILKTSFSFLRTSFTIFENKFLPLWKDVPDLYLKEL